MGVTQLGRPEREVWLMPYGHLMDQIACHLIWNGLATPKREHYIDEVMPADVA